MLTSPAPRIQALRLSQDVQPHPAGPPPRGPAGAGTDELRRVYPES